MFDTQSSYISNIPHSAKDMTFNEFRSIRARYAYAAYSTIPDVLVFVSFLSQFTESTFEGKKQEAVSTLLRLEKKLKSHLQPGLKYFPLNPET